MAKNAFCVFLARFMETIHIKLPDKAIHFAMPKEEWKDNLLELGDILDDKIFSSRSPIYGFGMFLRLCNFRMLH